MGRPTLSYGSASLPLGSASPASEAPRPPRRCQTPRPARRRTRHRCQTPPPGDTVSDIPLVSDTAPGTAPATVSDTPRRAEARSPLSPACRRAPRYGVRQRPRRRWCQARPRCQTPRPHWCLTPLCQTPRPARWCLTPQAPFGVRHRTPQRPRRRWCQTPRRPLTAWSSCSRFGRLWRAAWPWC
jgi:hypothetical protein